MAPRLGNLLTCMSATALVVGAALVLPLAAQADDGSPYCMPGVPGAIQVTVDNVRSSDGLVTAVLYGDDPETFLKRGARLDRVRIDARAGKTDLCLQAPATGHYSVAVYHDENGNKQFDRGFIGVPKEGYGFSANPGFRLGKPDLVETLFQVGQGKTRVSVSMLYLTGD